MGVSFCFMEAVLTPKVSTEGLSEQSNPSV